MLTVVMLLLVAQLALSVEVSQDKLDELTAIWKDYGLIAKRMLDLSQRALDLSNSSKMRIDDLQTGFDQYKATVDVLLAKTKRQECDVVLLKVGLATVGLVAIGLGAWVLLK
jgi:hypothetical protein